MRLSEPAQELLENWWRQTEGKPEPAPLAALSAEEGSQAISEVCAAGLGRVDAKGLELTETGIAEARSITRRHLLAERLLVDVLDTGAELVEERACRLEHALQDGVDESICRLLGHPTECPHGMRIPPGPCCVADKRAGGRAISRLSEMRVGEQGSVAYLQGREPDQVRKLMAMGVLPGTPIALIQHFPSFVFRSGGSEFAVDAALAGAICVRLGPRHVDRKRANSLSGRGWRFRWGKRR